MGVESPPITAAYELAQRYQLGLNIALPAGWNGRVWFAETKDSNSNHTDRQRQQGRRVGGAWAGRIGATPASGTTPAIGTWTKPANVPYLNLFCDPTAYTVQLRHHARPTSQAIRSFDQKMLINEKGMNFDGPLFDLPGGTVKAAVGATYTSYHFSFLSSPTPTPAT